MSTRNDVVYQILATLVHAAAEQNPDNKYNVSIGNYQGSNCRVSRFHINPEAFQVAIDGESVGGAKGCPGYSVIVKKGQFPSLTVYYNHGRGPGAESEQGMKIVKEIFDTIANKSPNSV